MADKWIVNAAVTGSLGYKGHVYLSGEEVPADAMSKEEMDTLTKEKLIVKAGANSAAFPHPTPAQEASPYGSQGAGPNAGGQHVVLTDQQKADAKAAEAAKLKAEADARARGGH